MTAETQLRAKRTRIKILRAIAQRNGLAGFSDIKVNTGLSTGSIYYHLERMGKYVTRDSKHYAITEEGLRFLREADPKYSTGVTVSSHTREATVQERAEDADSGFNASRGNEAAPRKGDIASHKADDSSRRSAYRRLGTIGAAVVLTSLGILYFLIWDTFAFIPLSNNASMILFITLVAALASSFYFGRRISPPVIGHRGLVLSILSVAVIFAGIVFLSEAQFIGASSPRHNNSMDALLSSYSLHWQVR